MSLRADKKNRLLRRVANLAAVFGIFFALGGQSLAANPYFKVTGGDVATGGWFNYDPTPSIPCTGSGYYQAPDFTNSTTLNNSATVGGILSFVAPVGLRPGAKADYGAYSLGLVEYKPASVYGFNTGVAAVPLGTNTLSFANYYAAGSMAATYGFNNAGSGGLLDGGGQHAWHCIPDYYDDYQSSPTDLAGDTTVNLSTDLCTASCSGGKQYIDNIASGSVLTISATASNYSVPAGKDYTIFVNGNVYINTNVSYAAHDATNVPRFALVVRGNIWIANTVTNLDGIYVAQPDPNVDPTTTDTGQLWTCQNSTGSWTLSSLNSFGTNCKANNITFHGSVIAARVLLTRMGDGIAATCCGYSDNGAAETFIYTPETVIGGSFTPSGSSSQTGQIDSLVSLPPVF